MGTINKYNLRPKDIKNLTVLNREKICEPLFWRNNIINAWCITRTIGTDADRRYGADNSIWIGIYDEPYYGKYVRFTCDCYGGMCSYDFKRFFDEKEIENDRDRKTQEILLEIINQLIDDGILGLPEELKNNQDVKIMLHDCNNCKHINFSEDEQNEISQYKREYHHCKLYDVRLFHRSNRRIHNRFIFPCGKCMENNCEEFVNRRENQESVKE